MNLPPVLLFGVAGLVVIFGVYRIRLGFRSDVDDARAKARKGLYAMGRRTHFLIGIIYLLLGTALIATGLGWSPFGSVIGPSTTTPSKDKAPSQGIPVDKLGK
jgi:hypothetical protein